MFVYCNLQLIWRYFSAACWMPLGDILCQTSPLHSLLWVRFALFCQVLKPPALSFERSYGTMGSWNVQGTTKEDKWRWSPLLGNQIKGPSIPLTWTTLRPRLEFNAHLENVDDDSKCGSCHGHTYAHNDLRAGSNNMYGTSIDDVGESRVWDLGQHTSTRFRINLQWLLSQPVHDELPSGSWRRHTTCFQPTCLSSRIYYDWAIYLELYCLLP